MRSYRGLAVISLHADSCVNLSGFKVAGRSSGPSAAASTRLVQALTASYAAATGLSFHHNTVTLDMTRYHAFGEIDPGTPVAIIEMGFMGGDRALLTTQQDAIVRGLVEGLLEFLKTERTRD
jgi:N-acetylmuramoyl-L-alanine amidase